MCAGASRFHYCELLSVIFFEKGASLWKTIPLKLESTKWRVLLLRLKLVRSKGKGIRSMIDKKGKIG